LISSVNSFTREKNTVVAMLHMYCKNHHNYGGNLCRECGELKQYAITRLNKCRYGISKPPCRECKTHCYSSEMREKIIKVMRFSGPRMIFFHPIYAFHYIIRKIRTAE